MANLGAYGDHTLRVTASVNADLTVWLYLVSADVRSELGVYGPYGSREAADAAAREAVAHAARMIQAHRSRLLAELIDV